MEKKNGPTSAFIHTTIVIVRKISENLLTRQLGGKVCILHDGISRQKQIPTSSTLANIQVFKKRARASKNNYESFNIFPVLPNLFKSLFSKQLAEVFKIILLIKMSLWFYIRKGYDSQHCLQMMLET